MVGVIKNRESQLLQNFVNFASGGCSRDMIVIMSILIRESMKIVIMKAVWGPLWRYLNALSQWFSKTGAAV